MNIEQKQLSTDMQEREFQKAEEAQDIERMSTEVESYRQLAETNKIVFDRATRSLPKGTYLRSRRAGIDTKT